MSGEEKNFRKEEKAETRAVIRGKETSELNLAQTLTTKGCRGLRPEIYSLHETALFPRRYLWNERRRNRLIA